MSVLVTAVVVVTAVIVLAIVLLGAVMWMVDWLMESLERIEPMPPLEDDEREGLEEYGRGYLRGLIAGIRRR